MKPAKSDTVNFWIARALSLGNGASRSVFITKRRKPLGFHISGTAQAVRSGPAKNLCHLRRDTGGLAPYRYGRVWPILSRLVAK